MRPYTNCTGEIWYVPLIPILKGVFWSQQHSLYSPGKYVNWNLIFSMVGFHLISYGDLYFKSDLCGRTRTVQVKSGMYIDSHLERCVFGPNSIAVQSWEVCALEIEFFQWRSCVSCREFFKVTCAAVHELYRSNLVWPLIPILKGVFWSKQHSFTVLGSMCTGNWIFSMEILC